MTKLDLRFRTIIHAIVQKNYNKILVWGPDEIIRIRFNLLYETTKQQQQKNLDKMHKRRFADTDNRQY